ncbi:MAG: HTTM domain-containing protein [Nannocystaceae bacterium]|nr:HTTM domain-containing protein [Nannocystaceae bacterium]
MIAAWWRRFFFGDRDVRPLALMRIGVGVIVMWMLLERIAVARSALSDEGWLPSDAARALMDPWHWSLFHTIDQPVAIAALLLLGAACALLFTVGFFTRWAGMVAFVILASTHVRNPAVLYGADSVARIWLFYLLLIPCGRAWSIDAIRTRIRTGGRAFREQPALMGSWPVRLLQFQVALVYLATGVSKFYGSDFHEGTALWFALANPTYSRFYVVAEPALSSVAPVLAVLTLVTLWWELAFAFMLPLRSTRRVALVVGLFVHGGIFVAMQIQFWGPLMLLSYLSFVSGRGVHRLWIRHVRETRDKRWPHRIVLRYDPTQTAGETLAARLQALDSFGLIRCVPERGVETSWVLATGDVVPESEARARVRGLLPLVGRFFF